MGLEGSVLAEKQVLFEPSDGEPYMVQARLYEYPSDQYTPPKFYLRYTQAF